MVKKILWSYLDVHNFFLKNLSNLFAALAKKHFILILQVFSSISLVNTINVLPVSAVRTLNCIAVAVGKHVLRNLPSVTAIKIRFWSTLSAYHLKLNLICFQIEFLLFNFCLIYFWTNILSDVFLEVL